MIRPLDQELESRQDGPAQRAPPRSGSVAMHPKADLLCSPRVLSFMAEGGRLRCLWLRSVGDPLPTKTLVTNTITPAVFQTRQQQPFSRAKCSTDDMVPRTSRKASMPWHQVSTTRTIGQDFR